MTENVINNIHDVECTTQKGTHLHKSHGHRLIGVQGLNLLVFIEVCHVAATMDHHAHTATAAEKNTHQCACLSTVLD